MAYLGNDLQVAYQSYKNIDDISSSFNGSNTSFALLVNGSAPSPLPINSQQCLISVGGVLQRPDDTGAEGFRLSGGNIIFSSAPASGEDFFGVILAGADYVNVGANFPDGSVGAPSITFDQNNNTGFYRPGSGQISFSSDGVNAATFGLNSFTARSFTPTGSTVPTNGFYLPSANSVAISTNGTQRATVDSSGRLLVGTSSTVPDNTKGGFYSLLQVKGYLSTPTGDARVALTRGEASTSVTLDERLGTIYFTDADGGTYAEIASMCDGTVSSSSDTPGRLVFSTTADGASSPTERMRISNDGGTSWRSTGTSSTHDLGNNNASFVGDAVTISTYRNTTDSTYNLLTCVRQGFAVALYIRDSGNVQNANNSYTGISDIKLKENIVDANSQWKDIKSLKVRNYNFKVKTGHPTHRQIGLIAQEVEAVCPGLVDEAPDRDFKGNNLGTTTKGVNYSVLYMKAVKALQEAMERIEKLEFEITAVKAKLN